MRVGAEIEGEDAALAVAAALDDVAPAVSAFELREAAAGAPALWRVEAWPAAPVLDAELEIRLALLAAGAGGRLIEIAEERLRERDWLAENRRAFPPLRIGRFFVHGSHWSGTGAARRDPARNRRGDRVRHRRASLDPRRVCWRSTGWRGGAASGGRSISAPAPASWRSPPRSCCAATCWRATSIAPPRGSRRTTSGATVCAAGCGSICAPGYRARAVRRSRYDLIFANILARPLSLMARDLAGALAPGGVAVLAGLLRRQEPMVLGAHRMQGLAMAGRLAIDGWSTLILRRSPARRRDDRSDPMSDIERSAMISAPLFRARCSGSPGGRAGRSPV